MRDDEVVAPRSGEKVTSTGYADATVHGLGHLTRVYGTRPVDPVERAAWLWGEQRRLQTETRLGIPALVHEECLTGFAAWKAATGLGDFTPVAIDQFDSGQLLLEAAANGLGIAIMHDDHFKRSGDDRLARLYDFEVESPYSYWFVCRPRALDSRPVRLFHDWLVKAGV